jgi:hypothetical protein
MNFVQKPTRLILEFTLMKDDLTKDTARTCSCGSKSFRVVHRIEQTNGHSSVMFECTECGEYTL